jgi:hypothetical protein
MYVFCFSKCLLSLFSPWNQVVSTKYHEKKNFKWKSIHVFTLNQTFGCTLYLDSSSSCSTPIHVSLYSSKAHKQGLYPTQNVHQLYGQLNHGQLSHFHTMLLNHQCKTPRNQTKKTFPMWGLKLPNHGKNIKWNMHYMTITNRNVGLVH